MPDIPRIYGVSFDWNAGNPPECAIPGSGVQVVFVVATSRGRAKVDAVDHVQRQGVDFAEITHVDSCRVLARMSPESWPEGLRRGALDEEEYPTEQARYTSWWRQLPPVRRR